MGHDILAVQCGTRASFPGDRTALEDLGGEPRFGAGQAKTAVQILRKLPPAGLDRKRVISTLTLEPR